MFKLRSTSIPIKVPYSSDALKSLTLSRLLTTQNQALDSEPDEFPDNPSSSYYDSIIQKAALSGEMGTVREALNKRAHDHFFNTAKTFKFLTATESSLSLLDPLIETLAGVDKGFARKSAYDALIMRLSKLNLIDQSMRVVETMAKRNFGLNAVTFHPILNALTRKGKTEEAWQVMDKMDEFGVFPDLVSYNYLLIANCSAKDLKASSEVMKKIEEKGYRADSRTYDALVLGACKVGEVGGAMVLVKRMVEEGVTTLYCTQMHVINALLNMGGYGQAVKFVMAFAGRDKMVDEEAFGCLAHKLIRSQRFEDAIFVLEEMTKGGLKMGDFLKQFYANEREKYGNLLAN